MEWTQYVDDDVVALAEREVDELPDEINEELSDEEMNEDVQIEININDEERLAENLGDGLIRSSLTLRSRFYFTIKNMLKLKEKKISYVEIIGTLYLNQELFLRLFVKEKTLNF